MYIRGGFIYGGIVAYGSDAEFISYLARTGRTLSGDASVAREIGSMWVDSFETRFKSIKVLPGQEQSFPRKAYNPIPQAVIFAAYEAGFAYSTGIDIFGEAGGQAGGQVTKEKVDVLEVQYAAPTATNLADLFEAMRVLVPMAYQYLLPYLRMEMPNGGPAVFVAARSCQVC